VHVEGVFLFLLAVAAGAQPRPVELFGHVGRARLTGDEGSIGGATSYGGGVIVPITGKWAFHADVTTGRRLPYFAPIAVRQTQFAPAVTRRWGTNRIYGFVGAGPGVQWESREKTAVMLHGTGGVVISPVSQLLIRGDMFVSFRYLLPLYGIRVGVGWRL
jgi:hypothetical protein